MENAEVLRRLTNIQRQIGISTKEDLRNWQALEIAAGGFCKMEEKQNDDWVPVSERLPESDKPVLVTIIDADGEPFTVETQCMYCDINPPSAGVWLWYFEAYEKHWTQLDYEVVAWRPWPEPYKEFLNGNN